MTIDEAIAHAREVAKRRMAEYENHYDKDTHYYPTQCKRCAEEHIQLAEWLEELKQYRAIGTPEECRASVKKQNANQVVEQLEAYSNADEAERLGTMPVVELADAIKIVKGGGADGN